LQRELSEQLACCDVVDNNRGRIKSITVLVDEPVHGAPLSLVFEQVCRTQQRF
jgi:hypothetical protein